MKKDLREILNSLGIKVPKDASYSDLLKIFKKNEKRLAALDAKAKADKLMKDLEEDDDDEDEDEEEVKPKKSKKKPPSDDEDDDDEDDNDDDYEDAEDDNLTSSGKRPPATIKKVEKNKNSKNHSNIFSNMPEIDFNS